MKLLKFKIHLHYLVYNMYYIILYDNIIIMGILGSMRFMIIMLLCYYVKMLL